jgi:cobaltochelatase CobT
MHNGLWDNVGESVEEIDNSFCDEHKTFSKDYDMVKTISNVSPENYFEIQDSLGSYTTKAHRMANLFEAKERSSWVSDKTQGRINSRRLPSLLTGDVRVFKEKTKSDGRNVCVTLLIDFSSSMAGERMFNTIAAAYLLGDVLSIAGIPFEILGFTTSKNHISGVENSNIDWFQNKHMRHKPVIIYELKRFDGPFNTRIKQNMAYCCTERFIKIGMDATPLYDGIETAHNRLIVREEERKICFALTDGRPSFGSTNSCRSLISEIELGGFVEIIGVGMMSDVSKLFSKSIYLESAEQIVEEMYNSLSKIMNIKG